MAASLLVDSFGGIKGLTSPHGVFGNCGAAADCQRFIDQLRPLLHVPPGMTLDTILAEVWPKNNNDCSSHNATMQWPRWTKQLGLERK